jgi:hypothetical protein
MMAMRLLHTSLIGLIAMASLAVSKSAEPNYDEAAVRRYTLPDVLAGADGSPARDADDWRARVRPHQLELLEKFVYGRRLPAVPVAVVSEPAREIVSPADGPQSIRIQARLSLGMALGSRSGKGSDPPTTDVLLRLPATSREKPVPVFLSLNFLGNQAEDPDPAIHLAEGWVRNDEKAGTAGNRATEASRGANRRRWPQEAMLRRGYGMATAYYGDFFPDRADGRPSSVLPMLGRPADGPLPPDEPGAIAAWAWGLSRILDWLVTLPEVDAKRVIVVGHSRLGKAALWAGGCDERFAMVVSNESGCGGAALSRRNFGETIGVITSRFPHWFCPALATYADRETELPTDQHALLALTAPRPLYVASAEEDRWADPRGEFLAAVAAGPVWRLFGREGLGTDVYPPVGEPVGQTVGYHVRPGPHDLLEFDWQQFADFADRTVR